MANMQKIRHLRTDKVIFKAPIISHAGEFSSDLFDVVDWLCAEAYVFFAETIDRQPLGPKVMRARFRCQLLDSLAMANVRGVGTMLIN